MMSVAVSQGTFVAGSPHAPVSFLHLHFDVLVLVLEHLTRCEHLQLMCASRSLQTLLVPHLLRLPFTLRRTERLRAFNAFMLRDAPLRILHLHRLTIGLSYFWSTRLSEGFATVLRAARNLEELSLLDAGLLEDAGDVPHAIAAMPALRRLKVCFPQDAALAMLRAVEAPLTRVDVSFKKAKRFAGDPVALLAKQHASLAELCVSLPRFADAPDESEASGGVRFEALTELIIKCHQAFRVAPVVYHYPNVRRLTVLMCAGHCWHGGGPSTIVRDEAEIEAMHEANGRERAHVWTRLQHVRVDAASLYAMNLACAAPSVDVVDVGESDVPRIGPVLKALKPAKLVLRIKQRCFWAHGLGFVQDVLPSSVQSVAVAIDDAPAPNVEDKNAMEQLALCSQTMTHLIVVWDTISSHRLWNGEANLPALAQRYAETNPALEYLLIAFKRPEISWGWRMGSRRAYKPTTLYKLSDEEIEQIMADSLV
ncbi:hypothetical protein BDW22DRAFT_1482276 [Trametopsis cervina]|nr:hypothetical protein BDW22DRAFT_1482276 [Trametopsis cervina]